MSWVQSTPLVQGPGEEGDVFDEEADESLLVQREWQSHMLRRVKVKLRGGSGEAMPGCGGDGRRVVRSKGLESRGTVVAAWPGAALPTPLPSTPALVLLGFSSGVT